MKHPCEIMVIDILPIVRKELSLELLMTHGLTKTKIAKLFNVSGTAISQYVRLMRGASDILENSPFYDAFTDEITRSAEMIATKKSRPIDELCRICKFVKDSGLLNHVCTNGGDRADKCPECPKTGLVC